MFVRPPAVESLTRKTRRKKNPFRLFATSALVMSATLAGTPASAQTPAQGSVARTAGEMRFDIAAGPLDQSLRAFEAATGLSLVVALPADTLAMMHSPGVSGVFAPEAALTALLDGTSLAFHMTAPGSIAIEVRGVRESVEVHGSLPRIDSPKLTEPLRDIPQTITVIPRAVIEQQGATTLRDVLRNVAGITFQAGEGGVPAGDQLTHSRLQRPDGHLHRRRARLRRLLARFVQPRAGRDCEGPVVVDRRPRLDRRRDQPGEQGADGCYRTTRVIARRRQCGYPPLDRPQPASRRDPAPETARSSERDVDDSGVPGRDG